MRKWLGIGVLCAVGAAGAGASGYWLAARTTGWIAQGLQVVEKVRGLHAVGPRDDGNAEPSDVVEPLVVDDGKSPAPEQGPGELDDAPARVTEQPGAQTPPRPDADSGEAPRMPLADEEPEPVAGSWLSVSWTAFKAALSNLELLREKEMTPVSEPPSEEPMSIPEEPSAPPQPEPARDYHQNEPHCPYHGPCPSPYRW